jgi:hypothetical protein
MVQGSTTESPPLPTLFQTQALTRHATSRDTLLPSPILFPYIVANSWVGHVVVNSGITLNTISPRAFNKECDLKSKATCQIQAKAD